MVTKEWNATDQVIQFFDVEVCAGSKRHIRLSLKKNSTHFSKHATTTELRNSSVLADFVDLYDTTRDAAIAL